MTAREIAALFEDLELRLIASLKRNLARHKAKEKDEGFDWPAWQAEKLHSLQRFRRENKSIMAEYSDQIDAETRALMRRQFAEADGSAGAFFGVNARKLDALIDGIAHSEARVERAALRYMDDVYRKTILRAAAALDAGGMTVQQATDLATKDFLAQGINCVRYKNGRMVNIASYAEMALRTNSTRAMLLGEAQLRERMNIDTVLVSQYGGCSETCLPWQGLVYIDDVWQPYRGGGRNFGGTYGYSRNGRSYPLLSVAVRAVPPQLPPPFDNMGRGREREARTNGQGRGGTHGEAGGKAAGAGAPGAQIQAAGRRHAGAGKGGRIPPGRAGRAEGCARVRGRTRGRSAAGLLERAV